MVVQLNRELSSAYGEVSTTLFYEFPTLRAIAGELAGAPVPSAPGTRADGTSGAVRVPAARHTPGTAADPGPPAPDDAIAIIGMSGRYPQAENTDEFWANLTAGRDSISEIPRPVAAGRLLRTGPRHSRRHRAQLQQVGRIPAGLRRVRPALLPDRTA